MGRYTQERISEVPSRRSFIGALAGADKAQAGRAIERKISERRKQVSRKAPDQEARGKRELEFSANKTTHQEAILTKELVVNEARKLAVNFEENSEGRKGEGPYFSGRI